ncbi:MAG: hypothetical protein LH606_19950 [Cytophagaceae bacterium]|nr:hypothetical protein [Cytophagaceae bacterium]
MHNNLYFLWSSSLYDSQCQGSDRIWRNTRYNGRYASSFLLGKEFVRGERGLFRKSTLGLNIKLTYYGGYRDSPIDVAASRVQRETVYVEEQLFTKQLPAYFRTDIRLSWKKNRLPTGLIPVLSYRIGGDPPRKKTIWWVGGGPSGVGGPPE